jgi:hypothetical protein
VPSVVALHVVARRRDALPRLGHDMHQADFFHFVGAVDAAGEHHLLGEGRADPARYQAVGAHAGEEPEHGLREAKLGTAFRYNDVERQQRLEATAERVALRQPDRDYRQVKRV